MTLKVVAIANSGTNPLSARSATASGTSWSTANMPTFNNGSGMAWNDIAFSPSLGASGRFVAIADSAFSGNPTLGQLATSDDGGATWTSRATPNQGSYNSMTAVCWSDALSLFVIVTNAGPTTTKRVLTSPDGITWTERTLPDASKSLNGVCWSPGQGKFVAVGSANAIYYSSDGITWTAATGLPGTSRTWKSVCWAGGTGSSINKFVAIAQSAGGSNDECYSSDGNSWTQQTVGPGSGYSWYRVAYSIDLDRVIVIGGNTGVLNYSNAGSVTTWTQKSTGLGSTPFGGVCWSPSQGQWVVIGNNTCYTSPDSSTWTSQTAISAVAWNAVAPEVPIPGDSGTWASTESTDTLDGSGYLGLQTTWNNTEATDTMSAGGYIGLGGPWASTEAPDNTGPDGWTGSLTNFGGIMGYMTPTEPADVFAGHLAITVSGIWTSSEASDALHFFGKITIIGTWGSTEATDHASFVGHVVGQAGIWSSQEPVDHLVASGIVPVVGTFTPTERADTIQVTIFGVAPPPPRRIFFTQ